MSGRNGKPEARMEVICNLDLWAWSFQVGLPGALNDLDLLVISDYFSKVLTGTFSSVLSKYLII